MEADQLREILDLVEQSPPARSPPELTGGDRAGRAYLSRFHFGRLVSSALGEPPGAFRRRILLERAAYQLGVSGQPVIDIALGTGYGGPEA